MPLQWIGSDVHIITALLTQLDFKFRTTKPICMSAMEMFCIYFYISFTWSFRYKLLQDKEVRYSWIMNSMC